MRLARTLIGGTASGGAAQPRCEARNARMRATRSIRLVFAPFLVSPWPAASRPAPDASLTVPC